MKNIPRGLFVTILALCLSAALLPAFGQTATAACDGGRDVPAPPAMAVAFGSVNPFDDIAESDWFYGNVLYAYAHGLMNGTGPDTFDPEGTLTRAMFVTVLHRMSGDTGSYANGFSDVAPGAWYEPAVSWAYAGGIVSGVDENRFAPENDITREQLAVILFRYAKYMGRDVSIGEDTNILSYNDALGISEYAYPALQWACGAGIMDGDDDGNLNPQGLATRAEAAKIICVYLQSPAG